MSRGHGRSKSALVALACAGALAVGASSSAGAPTIHVLTPNAGQTWPEGSEQLITWTASDLSPSAVVTLWFWDGGAFAKIADVTPGQTSYTWTVPQTSASQGWIYIWSRVGEATEADAWSQPFAISGGPRLRILTPNPGRTWLVGAEQPITWTASELTPSAIVTLWFWDGSAFAKIVDLSPDQTSYAWTLPDTSATQGWIYIWSQVEGVTEAQAWSEPFPITSSALATRELSHGSSETQDLAAQVGPQADVDFYHLAQAPRSSYEVVVDATSGAIQPLVLKRLAADGTTVLGSSLPVGTGSSRSLRWDNPQPGTVNGYIRVFSGGCTTTCGPQDVYRIRMYETTYTIARFNNQGTQASVLILQNPTSYTIGGTLYFWSVDGVLYLAQPFSILGRRGYTLSTSTIPVLQGKSGTVTVANDARYGDLVGKVVSLDPTTGFSFDSPMTPRLVR